MYTPVLISICRMKLDLSGLESATLHQLSNDNLSDVFSPSPSFKIPNDAYFDGFQKAAMQMMKPAKGTTNLAFIFKDGCC